jgi:DNA topoisomerase IB
MAIQEVRKVKIPPETKKMYKKMMKEVAETVAKQLNNTPGMCLKSYINPIVFSDWRVE